MLKWIVIAVAVLGLTMGIWTVSTSSQAVPAPPPAQPPSVNPFAHGIAAAGVVEAASRNIEISVPEAGLVTDVFVQVNDQVKAGDKLFQLDPRNLQAEMARAKAAKEAAVADLARLEAQPRPEDLPPLRATVDEAKTRYDDLKDELGRKEKIEKQDAATEWEVRHQRYLVGAAKASWDEAAAQLAKAEAGAWEQDKIVAQAAVAQADAAIEAIKIRLDRLTVRSPINGTVLRREVEPGEYAAAVVAQPAMFLGDLSKLRIRAQVDEEDAPLLRVGAAGAARVRGPLDIKIPLAMVRIEPYAMPKMQLTGSNTERVDTRVVEVVFEVKDDTKVPIYPGQIVDVFIDVGAEGKR